MSLSFVLNGKTVNTGADPAERLIDVLRDRFGLLGCREGCGEGECGACSILLDGELVPSCIVLAGAAEGREVLTIEGYAATERFRVLSQCFAEAGAVQCGYCTPGMILAGEALLQKNPGPTEADIRAALAGNLCRCTGYNLIVAAIKEAARRGAGIWGAK